MLLLAAHYQTVDEVVHVEHTCQRLSQRRYELSQGRYKASSEKFRALNRHLSCYLSGDKMLGRTTSSPILRQSGGLTHTRHVVKENSPKGGRPQSSPDGGRPRRQNSSKEGENSFKKGTPSLKRRAAHTSNNRIPT